MASYFKDIWGGVSTVLIGMWITFRHLWVPTITIQYPREILPMNERTRARLVNHAQDCEVCFRCQRVCPVNIFTIEGIRAGKDEDLGMLPDGKPKKMHLLLFDIDLSKCVYCGLCVEECHETHSLRWETPVEECAFTREEMYRRFATITPEEKERVLKMDADRKAERAKAAEAKKAKVKVPGKEGTKSASTTTKDTKVKKESS